MDRIPVFMKGNIFYVIFILILSGCEDSMEDPFIRHFLIRKGEHYSTPRLVEVLQSDRLTFTAKFDQSAIYDFGDIALQSNKNKLLGFADCNSQHQNNSARFAWQWFNGRLEIYAYCYVDGEREERFIGVVKANEKNLYEIRLTNTGYVFYLNGKKSADISRANICETGVYYMLYPYFGGSIPAPHHIKIELAVIK